MNGVTAIEQKINGNTQTKIETDVNQIWSIKENYFQKTSTRTIYDNFGMYIIQKYGKEFINNVLDNLLMI